MVRSIIYIIFISIIFPIGHLQNFSIFSDGLDSDDINSNSIYEMIELDEKLWLRTGAGLSFIEYNDNIPLFYSIIDDNLPQGGAPAFFIDDNIMVISGSKSIYENGRYRPMGTGLSWSLNTGSSWDYISQPLDSIPDSGVYTYSNWGEQDSIRFKAITTPIYNISYDIEVQGDYIYATSFAGGLRRYNYINHDLVWELIPLPMDNQDSLICNEINISTYEYDPVDPPEGNDNHKAFSTFVDDSTIWVGTGDGVNKGIINTDNCIDWFHYNEDDGLGDRWVVGIKKDNENRLWLISWDPSLNTPIPHNLSYTEDDGETWEVVSFFKDIEAIVYDLYFDDGHIYASTNIGLYRTYNSDTDLWIKFNLEDLNNQPSFTDAVYTSHLFNDMWAGSPDGLFYSSNDGLSWTLYRSWDHMDDSSNDKRRLSAYPNPFYIDEQNQYNNDGHVRIVYYHGNSNNSQLDIFDFNMTHIINLDNPVTINSEAQFIWNGRNQFNQEVPNGVYFCRLTLDGEIYWTKLMVINS